MMVSVKSYDGNIFIFLVVFSNDFGRCSLKDVDSPQAIKKSGHEGKVKIGTDVAASEFWRCLEIWVSVQTHASLSTNHKYLQRIYNNPYNNAHTHTPAHTHTLHIRWFLFNYWQNYKQ